ncbi:ABC transporter ATP-binding protein [Amorphus coralli]|uniref:ABC transporter ATP-binding protein n=1 Tax=Amorphus coralli TaxID=340680 RepID=UPI0004054BC6|nr:ABC transporter ATP-binding protein [Amorphus coralli]
MSSVAIEQSGPKAVPRDVVVRADGVEKTFDGGVVALEGASFDVHKGEFVSVLGPSGCGKSTLLRLVAGLIERTGGSLTAYGTEVTAPRADIAMMFQRPTLLPWKTALDNVLLPTLIERRPTKEDRERAIGLLRLTGLTDFEFAYPQHLSGGMQQRVALARLLNAGADLLLLDEPFGALDEFTRERLNLELLRIQREIHATIMFVTHNIAEAVFLSDKVLVMTPRPGRLAAEIDVPFARPRAIELTATPEFNALVLKIRDILGSRS